MIAFGTAVSDPDTYEKIGLPSIRRVAEPGSAVLTRVGYDSIQQPYNEMLDQAAALPGLEALILLHQDLQLEDASLLDRVRLLLQDFRVGLIGLLGGRDIAPHRFWATANLFGTYVAPGLDLRHTAGAFEVEAVDGALLAIAPWVVRSIRFGGALKASFHGYDADFSFRVRAAGGRVICDDIPHVHQRIPHLTESWKSGAEVVARSAEILSASWDPERQPHEWAPAFQR